MQRRVFPFNIRRERWRCVGDQTTGPCAAGLHSRNGTVAPCYFLRSAPALREFNANAVYDPETAQLSPTEGPIRSG